MYCKCPKCNRSISEWELLKNGSLCNCCKANKERRQLEENHIQNMNCDKPRSLDAKIMIYRMASKAYEAK